MPKDEQEQPTEIYEIRLSYRLETTKYIEAQNQLQASQVAKILFHETDVTECECVDSDWNADQITSRRELADIHKYDLISHELEDVLKMLKEQDYKERHSFLAVKEKGETDAQ